MKKINSRAALIITIILLVLAFYIFDLGRFLTLDSLRSSKDSLIEYRNENYLSFLITYCVVYITSVAVSLPGATILTLAAGAIFGFVQGTIIVSFTSTIGATLAFLFSRFLFRDVVQKRFRNSLEPINHGIDKEGAFYLFALRLVPAFPFFAINLVMGLTSIKVLTFFFVSQIGMFPGTMAYVYAGTQLGQIESLSGILSPGLITAFAILGLLPLISKRILEYLRVRKQMKKYPTPPTFDYNMVVLGAGSAGLVSSYIGAALKAKVALVEKHKMGGDCLNTGCVPSKALIRSAKMLSYAARAKEFGFKSTSVEFDFAEVMERVQNVIKIVEPHDSVERFTSLGVDCYEGEAKILDPYTVQVNGERLTTRNIIVATGARPFVPEIPGLSDVDYLTSDTLWEIRELPKKLVVLGGGPIGAELSQAMHRLGAEVTIVERNATILQREDPEVSELITETFKKEGVRVLSAHSAERFEKKEGKDVLICSHDGEEVEVEFDRVLVALGRKANVTGFGLEELDIELSGRGTVEADPYLRTNYPNIYVCGDVTGPYQFTHTAAHQAWFASINSLFSPFKSFKVDYRVIPWCTFVDPEVARVGLSEREAKEKGIDYQVTTYGIDDLDRAIADSEAKGFVKVLTPRGALFKKDRILGATIVGPHAGDLIIEYITAMKNGLGLNKILGTIHIYPTLAEANKFAAGNWKRENAPQKILAMLGKFHAWRRGKKEETATEAAVSG